MTSRCPSNFKVMKQFNKLPIFQLLNCHLYMSCFTNLNHEIKRLKFQAACQFKTLRDFTNYVIRDILSNQSFDDFYHMYNL